MDQAYCPKIHRVRENGRQSRRLFVRKCTVGVISGTKDLHLSLLLKAHVDPSLLLRMTVWVGIGSPHRVSAHYGQPKGCRCSGQALADLPASERSEVIDFPPLSLLLCPAV